MRSFLLLAALWLGALAPAAAQTSNSAPVFQTYSPTGRAALSVTSSSSNVALPGSVGNPTIRVCNTGSTDAYIAFGTSNAVSTTAAAGYLVQQGTCVAYSRNPIGGTTYSYVAGITASSTTTLYIEAGIGSVSGLGRAGGGASSGLVVGSTTVAGASNGNVLYNNNGVLGDIAGSGTGTVTSVDASVPAYMSVTGGPITTTGTLAFDFSSQSGNKVLASPANGSSGGLDMRQLSSGDLSDITAAGTAMVSAANAAAQTALLSAFVGDSGSGGTKGLVPAPTTGDATKFLKGDGTWATAGGASGITVGTTTITSGTSTRILYDNSGVVGEYTLSGSGTAVAMATSPVLTTPTLGAASATTINKVALTAPATGSTLTIADGKTLTASNTLTFAGTDGSTLNVGTGGTLGTSAFITLGSGVGTWLATPSSANLAAAVTGETGSGALVFATSPTLVTPVLGVASGTSLALGGATPGLNALAVTGTSAFSSTLIVGTTSSGIELGATSGRNLTFYSAIGGPGITARLVGDSTGSGGPARWQIGSTGTMEWYSTTSIGAGPIDTVLSRNAAGVVQFGTTAANSLGRALATGFQTVGATVAALPTCVAGLTGDRRHVTDALTPTYLTLAVGGGAVVAPVFCNGSQWVTD